MDADHDPIRELREALRQRPATWELEHTARPRRLLPRRPDRRPYPQANLRRHLNSVWRRRGPASRQALRSAQAIAVALAQALGVIARLTARTAIAALVISARVLLVVGLRLRSFGASCRATVARLRRPARRTVAHRESAHPARPATPTVERHSTQSTADDTERGLEAADRRRLEQRVLALGPDHTDVAVLLQLVAERCAARGASDEALLLYERALRIQENAFGPNSPALRPLLGDLAELERELGHDDEAILHEARRRLLERPSIPSIPTDRTEKEGVQGAA